MANNDWLELFPQVRLLNLVAPISNHTPILLQCDPFLCIFLVNVSGLRMLGFLNKISWGWSIWVGRVVMMVILSPSCLGVWISSSHGVKGCRQIFKHDILVCMRLLEDLQDRRDETRVNEFRATRDHMVQLLIREKSFWRQGSKVFWLQDGDLNTRFFHASTTSRSKVNIIHKLQDDGGFATDDPNQIKAIARSYFENLFLARVGDYDPVVNTIVPCLSSEDNVMLLHPFSILEFSSIFGQMHADKSSGPDGFNPVFYKNSWELCSDDNFNACCFWLERGFFPTTINDTNIAFIPKNDNPEFMKD